MPLHIARFVLLVAMTLSQFNASAATLSWSELQSMPEPTEGKRIAYGSHPLQFGELRLPQTASKKSPAPIIVLIHGGCWLSAYDYQYFNKISAWFSEHGFATWNIEYRRIGDEGGAWPNTFLDVAQATDFVKTLNKTQPIDPKNVFVGGHSAGGHLALWAAARGKLSKTSDIYTDNPISVRGVIGMAAIADLADYRVGPENSCHGSVDKLLKGTPKSHPERFANASPAELLPLRVPQIFIQGELDPIVSPASVEAYITAADNAGDQVRLVAIPEAGHFEASVPHDRTLPALHIVLNWMNGILNK